MLIGRRFVHAQPFLKVLALAALGGASLGKILTQFILCMSKNALSDNCQVRSHGMQHDCCNFQT